MFPKAHVILTSRAVFFNQLPPRLFKMLLNRLAFEGAPRRQALAQLVPDEDVAIYPKLVTGPSEPDTEVEIFVSIHELLVPAIHFLEDVAPHNQAKPA